MARAQYPSPLYARASTRRRIFWLRVAEGIGLLLIAPLIFIFGRVLGAVSKGYDVWAAGGIFIIAGAILCLLFAWEKFEEAIKGLRTGTWRNLRSHPATFPNLRDLLP